MLKGKRQSCISRKKLRTMLEMDEVTTKTNGTERRKANNDAYGLTSLRRYRQTIYKKKEDADSPELKIA